MLLFVKPATGRHSPPGDVPRIPEILFLYGLLLFGGAYLGGFFSRLGLYAGPLLFTALIGIVPAGYVLFRGMDGRRVFPLQLPMAREFQGGLLLIAGCFCFALLWIAAVLAALPSGIGPQGDATRAILGLPPWFTAVSVCLLPAACEEIFFRGFVLSGLREGTGKRRALAVSSLLFGIIHADPARIPLTAAVGFALGWAALETGSLVLPMLMHALYNGAFLWMTLSLKALEARGGYSTPIDALMVPADAGTADRVIAAVNAVFLLWPLAVAGSLLAAAGVRLLGSRAKNAADKTPRGP